jgi:transposase
MAGKSYSASFKFKVVREALSSDQSDAEIARIHDIHPNTLSKWKTEFDEQGPEIFGGDDQVKEYENRIAELEQMLGKKEVELALHKNFLNGRPDTD